MAYQIRRAAVIGSGTMGGAIAAHLANVGVPVDLLDIAPRELTPEEQAKGLTLDHPAVRNRIVNKGWEAVKAARPAALASSDKANLVRLGNLEDHFDRLAEADWIVEAIIENLKIKQDLMARLEKVRKPTAIVSTNTSGIPIHDIAEGRSKDFRQYFLGTHFFNPPRYLKLLEIIPHSDSLPEVLGAIIRFGEEVLGKGVVIAKDTPNFIGNRFFSLAGAYEIAYAMEHGYTVEEIDSIAGPLIGRPKSGVFRLLDLVGLDVMAHVNTNLYDAIAGDESRDLLKNDRFRSIVEQMVQNGWLGNKTGQGFYKSVKQNGQREFWHLDLETMEYKAPSKVRFDSVGKHRKVEPTGARIKGLIGETDRAAEFVRNATFHRLSYASRRLPEIADTVVAIDRAVKWGFMEELGPFEMWDALGVRETVPQMENAGFEVAGWVHEMLDANCDCFYSYADGIQTAYYDPQTRTYIPFEERPNEIHVNILRSHNRVVEENDDASILDLGDGVAQFEWHTKANTITPQMVEMGWRAIERLNTDFDGLVVGHEGELFCGGANLDIQGIQQQASAQGKTPADIVDEIGNHLQQLLLNFRYSPKPVVVAAFDRALGGGAEIIMAADRVISHLELYMGQVEVGVGLVPAGGGCKELLRRVVNPVMRVPNADPLPHLSKVFELVGLAKFSTSAWEAREIGFLGPCDRIIANRDQLLAEAKREAIHMWQAGYRPPAPEKIYAAGRDVLAAMQTQIFLLKDAGYASEHDAFIANKIAWILCGGDLSEPTWVDEQYILDLERKAFVELIQEPKTVERIFAMLSTGKPLRN